jgi:hypothetical protein
MENKLTAVEWLVGELKALGIYSSTLKEKCEQTKEIEKEQIETAYDCGYDDGKDEANGNGFFFDDKSDYYNQTFNN